MYILHKKHTKFGIGLSVSINGQWIFLEVYTKHIVFVILIHLDFKSIFNYEKKIFLYGK